ncbi:transglycosylase SLT domain-containing protein [Candidatus Woesearchaeota archaeon]|nr:transglycosylase SLT domain-containing protein [Candidatus Woesearchaeota archaeon]
MDPPKVAMDSGRIAKAGLSSLAVVVGLYLLVNLPSILPKKTYPDLPSPSLPTVIERSIDSVAADAPAPEHGSPITISFPARNVSALEKGSFQAYRPLAGPKVDFWIDVLTTTEDSVFFYNNRTLEVYEKRGIRPYLITDPWRDTTTVDQRIMRAKKTALSRELGIPFDDLFYKRGMRGRTGESLAAAQPYIGFMEQLFSVAGLPSALAWNALFESGFDGTAESGARAKGWWQFKYSTARSSGIAIGDQRNGYADRYDGRYDLVRSTVAAAGHKRELFALVGDWHLALEGYNRGKSGLIADLDAALRDPAVQARYHIDPDNRYWDYLITEARRGTPVEGIQDFFTWNGYYGTVDFMDFQPHFRTFENQNYPLIMAAGYVIATDPARFGFMVDEGVRDSLEIVMVPKRMRIADLARHAGIALDSFKALNPQFFGTWTPMAYDDNPFHVILPKGSAYLFYQNAGITLELYPGGDSLIASSADTRGVSH